MASELTGRVTFANGFPAAGVRVRIFDKDAPGKGDDDLTVEPGLSNERGEFRILFDPGRFVDFIQLPFVSLRRSGDSAGGIRLPDPLDILSPYVQFTYLVQGEERVHTAPLEMFQTQFKLPESHPVQFTPSIHGFRFINAFRGYMLPFTLPFLPDASKVSSVYGLCGGMSSAAYDYLLAGCPVPPTEEVPRTGTRLQRYLFRRAIDTFAMGESILRFARWMVLPDEGPNGTYHMTAGTFETVREALDSQRLVVLGLVLARGTGLQEIARNVWNNHQVLAFGYTAAGDGSFCIHLYDPNYPKVDDITIRAERVPVGKDGQNAGYGLRCTQMRGSQVIQPVRGFFAMPYDPADPPVKF